MPVHVQAIANSRTDHPLQQVVQKGVGITVESVENSPVDAHLEYSVRSPSGDLFSYYGFPDITTARGQTVDYVTIFDDSAENVPITHCNQSNYACDLLVLPPQPPGTRLKLTFADMFRYDPNAHHDLPDISGSWQV